MREDTQKAIERGQAWRIIVVMLGLGLVMGVIAPSTVLIGAMMALILYWRPLRRYVEGGSPLTTRR